jgi:DNA topoisomerase-1
VSGQAISVKEGRFGPYVTDGVTNASLRKGDTVEGVTLERAAELLAARREAAPVKRGAAKRSAGARKASPAAKKAAPTKKAGTGAKKVAGAKKAAGVKKAAGAKKAATSTKKTVPATNAAVKKTTAKKGRAAG